MSDLLPLGGSAVYTLVIDGTAFDSVEADSDCVEVLAEVEEETEVEEDDREVEVAVLAEVRSASTSQQLPRTGAGAAGLFALLGLSGVASGSLALRSTRRR